MKEFVDRVIDELRRKGELDEAGGEAYIRRLASLGEGMTSEQRTECISTFLERGCDMKRWVRLHKDGDHMGVETNCTDERDFWTQFSSVLASALQDKFLGTAQEQLQRWLPQAFECVAQLRGYKADVVVEQVVRAGEVYSGNQEVFTSERPQFTVVPKEQAG